MSIDLIQRLPLISIQINRIVPILQIILGTFGNIMNILIFTRRTLRTNPCSLYFLASSINNIFVLYVAALTRLLSSGWKIDPSNSNSLLCKLRIFFVYSSLCLIQWLMVLASFDRLFSSCHTVRYRNFSSLRLARRFICLAIVAVALAHFHILVWWTVDYIGNDRYCNVFDNAYEIAFQVFFLLFSCLLPPCFMTFCGLMTIVNIRKLRRQVAPQNSNGLNELTHSKDRQMIIMLLIQVSVTITCTAPFTAINLFGMIIQLNDTLVYSLALKTFIESLCRLMLYFNPIVGFYVYTLSSRVFRRENKRILKRAYLVIVGIDYCQRYSNRETNTENKITVEILRLRSTFQSTNRQAH
jgi:hypothetical protein